MGGGISVTGTLPSSYLKHDTHGNYCSPPRSFPLPCSPSGPSLSLISTTPKLTQYFIGSVIGQGGFGKIREIKRRRDDRWFALKSFEFKNMTLREAQAIVTELLALNRIPSHPFVIQLHAAFRERFAISFVMDLLVGGDLRLWLRIGEKLDETKIAYVVACVGSALHHIHLHQVIHRDVKPENVMFTSRGIPKLIDFGIAHLSPPSSKICVCQSKSGTVQYMSPEAMVPRTHCHGYETDFWSLGVVMYELLYLTRPYETRAPSHLVEYSGETYEATWKSLLADSESAREVSRRKLAASSSVAAATTAIVDPLSTPLPASASSVGLHSFHPIFEEDDDSPLPLSLRIPLPEISPLLNGPPSDHCTSLLSSLLDVRIHKRCGVGANFFSFSQHAFFVSQGMDVETVLSFPSPILPDLEKIGMDLYNQFFSVNLDDDISSSPSESPSPCPPRPEVEEYLTEIQSVTPLFYESKTDVSKHRDTKGFGTADWEFMLAS